MVYLCEDGSVASLETRYNDAPISNIRYDGDRLKVNANMNTNGTLCFVGGCVIGAALTYYLLKSINKPVGS